MNLQLINLIGNFASIIFLLITAVTYVRIRNDAVKNAHREATQQIYKEWWSDEMTELRRYFYNEFIPKYRQALLGKCIKEIEKIVAEDQGRTRKLCYFFERVGWLGAAGLIDVDYILGPMQHCLRFVWQALEPFIQEERFPSNLCGIDVVHHSVYMSGFEWLYKRSSLVHQADLIGSKFRKPRLRNPEELQALREWIDDDEAKFREEL